MVYYSQKQRIYDKKYGDLYKWLIDLLSGSDWKLYGIENEIMEMKSERIQMMGEVRLSVIRECGEYYPMKTKQ